MQELLCNITVKDESAGKFDDEEEDLIEKEKRDEMEMLRKQGIRQQKLAALRKEEEERCAIFCVRIFLTVFVLIFFFLLIVGTAVSFDFGTVCFISLSDNELYIIVPFRLESNILPYRSSSSLSSTTHPEPIKTILSLLGGFWLLKVTLQMFGRYVGTTLRTKLFMLEAMSQRTTR